MTRSLLVLLRHRWRCLLVLLLLLFIVSSVYGQQGEGSEEGGGEEEEKEEEKTLTQLLEEHRNELSLYISALQGIGLLKGEFNNNDNDKQMYTVLAPSDTAIRNDPHFFLYITGASKQPPTWHLHLRASVLHHIIQDGEAYTTDDLFSTTNTTNTSKRSMQNEVIHIDATKQTLGLTSAKLHANLVNLKAKNGILHIVDQVFPVELTTRSLAELENQVEFRSSLTNEKNTTSLIDIVDFVGSRGRDNLDETITSGLTHVGCSQDAFATMGTMINVDGIQQEYLMQTINNSSNGVRFGELLNASRKDETLYQFIDYSLLPLNFYRTDLPNDFEQLVMPVGNDACAHMWVTKRQGRVCFNAACQVDNPNYNKTTTSNSGGGDNDNGNDNGVIGPVGHDELPFREFIARNGYGYVVNQCLLCPGMLMLMDISAKYTSTPIYHSNLLFHRVAQRENWNLRHVVASVLQQAIQEYPNNAAIADFDNVKSITILAPTERAWEKLNYRGSLSKFDESFRGRLRDDVYWYLHLKHLILHCIIPQVYMVDELREMSEQVGIFRMKSFIGEDVNVQYDPSRQELQIDDKDVFLGDVKGIDGYMHFTESIPIPVALMNSVYTMARWDKDNRFRKQLNFVYHVGLLDYMQKRVPVTAFMVPNELWPGQGEDDEILREIASNPDVLEEVAPDTSIYELERTILLNHIFDIDGPWSCNDLRNMEGQVVEASNGKNRVIVYNEEKDAPCLAVQMEGGGAPPEILACVVECNILARNGIFHVLDRPIFHVEDPPTGAPTQVQPTASPAPSTGPPTISPALTGPSVDVPGNDNIDTGESEPSASAQPTVSAQPTITAIPTMTPAPTITNTPTTTTAPTITAQPTVTFAPTMTAKPTSTAAPTITETPTITAVPTTTARPSSSLEEATPTAGGVDDYIYVNMTFYGIRIPIMDVPQLDEGGQRFFQDVTKDWYEMVYAQVTMVYGQILPAAPPNCSSCWHPGRRNLQEAGIYDFTTIITYTDQAVSHPWNTITYNQIVSYLQAKEQQLVTDEEEEGQTIESNENKDSSLLPTPRDVLLSPFYDDLLVKNYTDRLRQHPLFANITDSGNPLAPRSADENNVNVGGGSRNYWNVYFILGYIGFGLAVASTCFLTVDLLLKLLLRPLPPLEEEGPPASEAPLTQPSGTRIEFDKRPSAGTSLN